MTLVFIWELKVWISSKYFPYEDSTYMCIISLQYSLYNRVQWSSCLWQWDKKLLTINICHFSILWQNLVFPPKTADGIWDLLATWPSMEGWIKNIITFNTLQNIFVTNQMVKLKKRKKKLRRSSPIRIKLKEPLSKQVTQGQEISLTAT